MKTLLKRLLCTLFLLPGALYAAPPAARVMMLTGEATAMSMDGAIRPLTKEDAVFSGDIISTGVNSYINLRFSDGGFFLLKPETRFGIEDFYRSPNVAPAAPAVRAAPAAPLVTAAQPQRSGQSRAFFRLVKGGFRAVSGLIGKIDQDAYRVVTPVATIGIRGTRYGGDLCDGDCADRTEINTQLRDAGTEPSETVLVTTVEEGEIAITTPQGTQNQGPGSALFVTEGGVITPASRVPQSIEKDQALKPEACNG